MSVRILIGDCRKRLAELPDGSVNCCVTSPPYFGLRDYGHDGQMGLEPTPDEFVAGMVEVFREVRRVLRDDGTLWLNIGDSYSGSGRGGYAGGKSGLEGSTDGQDISRVARGSQKLAGLHERACEAGSIGRAWTPAPPGLKQKDLIGIPWLLAFALRADGWYLRQDIIWSKPNPMPESVRDRCTKAHEYLFLLSKGPRYFYDQDAILEPPAPATVERLSQSTLDQQAGSDRVPGKTNGPMKAVRRAPGNKSHKGQTAYESGDKRHRTKAGLVAYAERERARVRGLPPRHAQYPESSDQSGLDAIGRGEGRNKRSVWTVATQPFSEAHFATYPPALIEPCILAGCPKGGTVIDPFFGAGTTGLVADRLQRDCIGIELNPEYAELARKRIASEAGMFGEIESVAA